jgi:hypothetical protein
MSLIPQLHSLDRDVFYVALLKRSIHSPVFAAFFLSFFASTRRSVFFRRLARFLALSLPRLCPITLNLGPLLAIEQPDETEVCVSVLVVAAALDAIPAPPNPEPS